MTSKLLYVAKLILGLIVIAAIPPVAGVTVKVIWKLFLLGFNLL